jgi:tetratricopeptide (TPR) repeat protein
MTTDANELLKAIEGDKPKEAEKPPAAAPVPAGEKREDAELLAEAEQGISLLHPATRPHAFVVMPFGKKKGGDGSPYDFNAIYQKLIKPALVEAGFEPFRADEETASGDILTDMFQELLLADLVLCDLSIDNANAFYELGIRHAFRRRGVMHIQAGRAYMPFDVFNVRTLPYHITPEGVPDPAFMKADIAAIARMARDTWSSDRNAIHSPVFNLLTGLKEPDRKALKTPLATGFWREYDEWKDRVTVAQRQKRVGDILLLTEEIRNPLIKEEAIGEAGKALASLGRNELALGQYRKGLEVNPGNLDFRRQEAFHLNRLGQVDEAIVKLEGLLTESPEDGEAIAYLGRIYKEMWVDSWKHIADKAARLKAAFEAYHWLIKSANIYARGYRKNLNDPYPGVNAHTTSTIAIHLADKFEDKKNPDPEIEALRQELQDLRHALSFTLATKTEDEMADYWDLVSLAELRVMTSDNAASVSRAYRKAITASRRNPFYLQSSLAQLEILRKLDMRVDYVEIGIKTLNEELARIALKDGSDVAASGKKKAAAKPKRQTFIFGGYMVDYPEKEYKAFPKDKEAEVRAEILKRLDKFNASENDRGCLPGLSAGSEIIFAELCVERGIPLNISFPLPDAEYIREFVSPGGDEWVERFYKARNHPLVEEHHQLERLGPPKEGDDLFERNNRWAVYSSLQRGVELVRLIVLWDGKNVKQMDRDARLVKHMVDLMREVGGQVEHINSTKFMQVNYMDKIYSTLSFADKPDGKGPKPGKRLPK